MVPHFLPCGHFVKDRHLRAGFPDGRYHIAVCGGLCAHVDAFGDGAGCPYRCALLPVCGSRFFLCRIRLLFRSVFTGLRFLGSFCVLFLRICRGSFHRVYGCIVRRRSLFGVLELVLICGSLCRDNSLIPFRRGFFYIAVCVLCRGFRFAIRSVFGRSPVLIVGRSRFLCGADCVLIGGVVYAVRGVFGRAPGRILCIFGLFGDAGCALRSCFVRISFRLLCRGFLCGCFGLLCRPIKVSVFRGDNVVCVRAFEASQNIRRCASYKAAALRAVACDGQGAFCRELIHGDGRTSPEEHTRCCFGRVAGYKHLAFKGEACVIGIDEDAAGFLFGGIVCDLAVL